MDAAATGKRIAALRRQKGWTQNLRRLQRLVRQLLADARQIGYVEVAVYRLVVVFAGADVLVQKGGGVVLMD